MRMKIINLPEHEQLNHQLMRKISHKIDNWKVLHRYGALNIGYNNQIEQVLKTK